MSVVEKVTSHALAASNVAGLAYLVLNPPDVHWYAFKNGEFAGHEAI
jgi:hypothetical protein